MALRSVAIGGGEQAGRGSGAAVPGVCGLVVAPGWLLALANRAAADRTHVHSTWPLRRSHALLADLVLASRLDEVEVIGQAIALKAAGARGLRPIAEYLGVPAHDGSDVVVALPYVIRRR